MKTLFLLSGIVLGLVACSKNDGTGEGPDITALPPSPVQLSEIVPVNADLKDAYDEDPGWVELYNPADTAFNLKGFSLTEKRSDPRAWTFGDVVLPPQGRLVVFLSGRDIATAVRPSDSLSLIGTGAGSWADSQNDPPGRSTAGPFAFPGILDSVDGKPAISGSITLADNSGTELTWSSASVFLGLGSAAESDTRDISTKDQIVLRGYLDAGKQLEVRLAQPGLDDWLGWFGTITGTGKDNELYTIALPASSGIPDLTRIYGIRFASAASQVQTIRFTFTEIIARKRGTDLHADFKLSRSGGSLYLTDTTGALRDSVAYPAVPVGLSYAYDAQAKTWNLSEPATPGEANSASTRLGQVAAPTDLPVSGLYAAPLKITLPATDSGIVLRCDTTGAEPTQASVITGGTLTLKQTTILRCAQFRENYVASPIAMRTYLIDERTPDLPVISIATDPGALFDPDTGLYMPGPNPGAAAPYWGANYWWDKELPVHIDFFEPHAKLAWTSRAGLKIFGNYSRAQPKKSVAIVFRERYGQNRLEYALFPEHPHVSEFKWFILRNNGSNNGRDYIRDALMSSLTEGLGIDYQKARPAIVYYNGAYFGIHDIREKSNEYYFESNYGYDPASIDLVKAAGEASAGSDGDYQSVMDWIAANPLKDNANYQWVREKLDVDNFTNYVQSEIFFVNKDWPGNNLKRWRSRSPQTPWKWFIYDTDFGFGGIDDTPEVGMLEFATATDGPNWPNPPYSTFLLRSLLENDGYKHAFVNRLSVLLATWFAPATVQARIDKMMAAVKNEKTLDQTRWALNAANMDEELDIIEQFGQKRAAALQSELQEFFDLSSGALLSVTVQGSGEVRVHGLGLPGNAVSFLAYPEIPVILHAVPNSGATFVAWDDGSTDPERTLTISKATTLKAIFR